MNRLDRLTLAVLVAGIVAYSSYTSYTIGVTDGQLSAETAAYDYVGPDALRMALADSEAAFMAVQTKLVACQRGTK